MIDMVKVTAVNPLDGYRLWLRFSNGREGIRDFSDVFAEGGSMVEPLRDPGMFSRAFIECGVLAWPNGFDLDSIALYREMEQRGFLVADATLESA